MQGSSASPLGGTGGRDRLAESFGTSAQLWSQHERAKTSPSVFHRPSWRPCLRGATCQQSHPILPSGLNRKLSPRTPVDEACNPQTVSLLDRFELPVGLNLAAGGVTNPGVQQIRPEIPGLHLPAPGTRRLAAGAVVAHLADERQIVHERSGGDW